MKNITLSVDEKVLTAARRYAAAHNSSVNRLVREYLASIAAREDGAAKVRHRIRQLSDRSPGRIGRRTWTRGELHED